jgi:hypothetical protein
VTLQHSTKKALKVKNIFDYYSKFVQKGYKTPTLGVSFMRRSCLGSAFL